MSTDVISKNITANGYVHWQRTRLRAISFAPVAAAGSIVLRNGGAAGTVTLTLDVGSGSTTFIQLPGDGVVFTVDIYAELTTVTSATFFFG